MEWGTSVGTRAVRRSHTEGRQHQMQPRVQWGARTAQAVEVVEMVEVVEVIEVVGGGRWEVGGGRWSLARG